MNAKDRRERESVYNLFIMSSELAVCIQSISSFVKEDLYLTFINTSSLVAKTQMHNCSRLLLLWMKR
jgi:hypothetical protein